MPRFDELFGTVNLDTPTARANKDGLWKVYTGELEEFTTSNGLRAYWEKPAKRSLLYRLLHLASEGW